jgi:hypothetical protein
MAATTSDTSARRVQAPFVTEDRTPEASRRLRGRLEGPAGLHSAAWHAHGTSASESAAWNRGR